MPTPTMIATGLDLVSLVFDWSDDVIDDVGGTDDTGVTGGTDDTGIEMVLFWI